MKIKQIYCLYSRQHLREEIMTKERLLVLYKMGNDSLLSDVYHIGIIGKYKDKWLLYNGRERKFIWVDLINVYMQPKLKFEIDKHLFKVILYDSINIIRTLNKHYENVVQKGKGFSEDDKEKLLIISSIENAITAIAESFKFNVEEIKKDIQEQPPWDV